MQLEEKLDDRFRVSDPLENQKEGNSVLISQIKIKQKIIL